MPKIYTKTGDAGDTGLIGGVRVPKDDPRVEAYGTIDEANSALGALAAQTDRSIAGIIAGIQRTLFDIGAELATPGPARRTSVTAEQVDELERWIDAWEEELPALRQFILPGGCGPAAMCHVARSTVRRAERRTVTLARQAPVNPEILRYLNRLSDCLFVLARLLNQRMGVADVLWKVEGGRP
jgi:cob(I)alamin adenosyltransferase